jgi:general secretion pathway protein F/type IV pilus assembly protein PilC
VTDWLLWTSQLIRTWWPLGVAVALFGFIAVRRWTGTAEGRRWIDGARLRVPGAGGVYLNLAVARFGRVVATLLRGGVPILRSLDISSQATANQVLGDAIRNAAENISGGESLVKPLAACGHFPPTVVEMIAVAEESNTLETVLADVADSLERHTWRRLELFVRLLEPVMLLVLAAAVLVVVLALLLPVMKVGMTI